MSNRMPEPIYELSDFEEPQQKRRGSVLPWVLLVFVLAGAGAGGYHLFTREQAAQKGWKETRASLRETKQALAQAKRTLGESEKALAAAKAGFATEKSTLEAELVALRTQAEASEELAKKLSGLLGEGEGELEHGGGRVTLRLVDQVLFRLGEAELTPQGIRVLERVAKALSEIPDQQIWVQGHTDTTPIRDKSKFPSNWELSTARAASVVHYLQDEAGLDPKRLAILGFGEHRPRSSKHSLNRRIDIVLFPQEVELRKR